MIKAERQNKMNEYINLHERVSVDELVETFEISRATVIRDLLEMSKKGRIYRTRGFAISVSNQLSMEMPYKDKEILNVAEKRVIGKLATKLIDDYKTMIIDSGSTTLELAKLLGDKAGIVMVNDVRIALEFSNYNHIELYMAPGKLTKHVYTLCGASTIAYISKLSVDITFLGLDAINLEEGIYNSEVGESELKKSMIDAANYVVALVDSSKFGKKAFVKVGEISSLDCIVTDKISNADLRTLKSKNIRVITPEIDTLD